VRRARDIVVVIGVLAVLGCKAGRQGVVLDAGAGGADGASATGGRGAGGMSGGGGAGGAGGGQGGRGGSGPCVIESSRVDDCTLQ
jgi:hypothetical protein